MRNHIEGENAEQRETPFGGRLTITVKEFCSDTSLSKSTAHKLIRENKLDACKVGTRTLIFVDSVKALLGTSSERRG